MFDTDRLIIVHYSQGCGGKFLINCLALADNAVMQHKLLANMQLDGKLDSHGKLKIILDKLAQVKNQWRDLGWGCEEYFGFDSDAYLSTPADQLPFDPVVKRTVENNKCFFLVSHDPVFLSRALAVWPRAQVVVVKNCNEFIACKRDACEIYRRLQTYWNKIRGADWPVDPPLTIDAMQLLPTEILEEVVQVHGDQLKSFVYAVDYNCGIEKIIDSMNRPVFNWDAMWAFGTNTMLEHIAKLANDLELDSVPSDHIEQYHREYIAVLDRIKNGNS